MLLPYHLRLAVRSLRRDPGLSTTIVIVLAVAAGFFCAALMHYLRLYGEKPGLPASLHQVEVKVPDGTLRRAFAGSTGEPNVLAGRMRVSYPNYRRLAGTGIPVRETASFRTRLLLQAQQGAGESGGAADVPPFRGDADVPRMGNSRFVNADFFPMFALRMQWGAGWSRDDEASGAAVVVLSRAMNARAFGGRDSVGRTLLVDGHPFRVVGVLAEEQRFAPEWDRVMTGSSQDSVYLPFAQHVALRARPEAPVQRAPVGPRYDDLLASSTVFVVFWMDLPTSESRAAYARHLAATFGGDAAVLRDLPTLRTELAYPRTGVTFFLFLTFVFLFAAGLITMRLLLAKDMARKGELAIYRALGAPRRSVIARQLLEASLLSAIAGALSLAVAGPWAALYNALVADTDIPLGLTVQSCAITIAATVGVGVLFALLPAWRAATRRPTAALVRT